MLNRLVFVDPDRKNPEWHPYYAFMGVHLPDGRLVTGLVMRRWKRLRHEFRAMTAKERAAFRGDDRTA